MKFIQFSFKAFLAAVLIACAFAFLHFRSRPASDDICSDPDIECAPNLSPEIRAQMAKMHRASPRAEVRIAEAKQPLDDLTQHIKFEAQYGGNPSL